MPTFVKSLLAILAGFVLAVALALGTDALLHVISPLRFDAEGFTQDPAVLALTLVYSLTYVVVGCSLAAFLAPAAPLRHALGLGVVGLVAAVFPVVTPAATLWNTTPAWYRLSLLVLLLPAAWLGGILGARSRPDSPAGAELED